MRVWTKWNAMYCWWEFKMMQQFWEIPQSLAVPQNLKHRVIMWPSHFTARCLSLKMKTYVHVKTCTWMFHTGMTHNNQKVEMAYWHVLHSGYIPSFLCSLEEARHKRPLTVQKNLVHRDWRGVRWRIMNKGFFLAVMTCSKYRLWQKMHTFVNTPKPTGLYTLNG